MKEAIQVLKTKFTPEEMEKLIPVLADGIETMLYDVALSNQSQKTFVKILINLILNKMETLIKIQGELKAPKNQYNSFGKYKYRSCEDILEAAKPLCVKNGALLTISDDIVMIGEYLFVKAIATFKHAEFTEAVTAFAKHSIEKKGMDDSQITGAASSYARKYALNGLFCIEDSKDSDTTNNQQTQQPKKLKQLPDEKFNEAVKFLKGGKSMKELKSYYEINEDTEFKLITASES